MNLSAIPEQRPAPHMLRTDDAPRRLGVELEFGDLALDEAVQIVQSLYGGRKSQDDPYRCHIKDSELGDFLVELDAVLAHPADDRELPSDFEGKVAEAIGDFAKLWLPMEIACPPIEIDQLHRLESLVQALREAGATGTGKQLYYAFGCQLNPELANLELPFVLRQFRAYLLLEDWLRHVAGRDLSRRLTTFANPFPRGYARHVLAHGYEPDWEEFVGDYLEDNPTRNRDLDLLPLFAHLVPEHMTGMKDKRIKARPTFHYRTPDSRIDESDWSLTLEWNRWVEVEYLADDEPRLQEWTQAFLDGNHDRRAWAAKIGKWLAE